jgi:pSer/pThr/pTyr-binding forkhead associated (FHA) protein
MEVIAGLGAGATILVEDEIVLGRQTGGAGQFPDAEMSRMHARIAREAAGDYGIEDLGSSNGTFVNGLRISAPTLLSVGDSIELGATALVVRGLPSEAVEGVKEQGVEEPTAAVAPSSAATTGPSAAPVPPTLALRLEVDFAACRASVALDDGGDVVTMTFVDGRWQAAPPS